LYYIFKNKFDISKGQVSNPFWRGQQDPRFVRISLSRWAVERRPDYRIDLGSFHRSKRSCLLDRPLGVPCAFVVVGLARKRNILTLTTPLDFPFSSDLNILNVNVELKGQDPFGQIRSGHLKVRGKVRTESSGKYPINFEKGTLVLTYVMDVLRSE
jgi:hypothetical protein